MRRIIVWFAHNPVAANLMAALIFLGGLAALPVIRQQSFPDMELDLIQIGVPYLGAAPEEVEEGVCIRIEEEIAGIQGIERFTSTASEGACGVSVEIVSGYPVDRALAEIKNGVDSIDIFPVETEEPVVSHYQVRHNELQIAVSGAASERALKYYGERLRDGILAMTDVTQAELVNARDYEISIEVPESSLRRHGLSFSQVASAVRHSSLDRPGGSIRTRGGEILLRSKGQAYTGEEFEKIVVLTRQDGTRVLLGEVARVVDGFEQDPSYARFDGEPAVMVQIFRVGEQKVFELVEQVKDYLVRFQSEVPDVLSLTVWQDGSEYLRDRLNVLVFNGMGGFLLVFGLLALFLRLRLAIWVALGIPLSFLGTLWLFPVLDLSVNALSLFAFILVLGIVVDDAIVVGENVHTHQERAEDWLEASVQGCQEVSVPVIFGVLTTVAAFLPLILAPGSTGAMFGTIGVVVSICLFFSLLGSMWILPAHLGHYMKPRRQRDARNVRSRRWKQLQGTLSESLGELARRGYRPALERALRWRYATLATAISLLAVMLSIAGSGRVSFSFFPIVESDYISASVTLPQGTPVEQTAAAVHSLEAAALRVRDEVDADHPVEASSVMKHILVSVGEQPALGNSMSRSGPGNGSHLGQVSIELISGETRPLSSKQIADLWRAYSPAIPEVEKLVFSSDYISMGDPIDFELRAADIDQLVAAADRLKQKLAGYPGVFDISDSFRAGKDEIVLSILPSAEALGLSLDDLARQVRQAFYGEEVQRIQRGRDDVRVMVRYPESQRRSLADLDELRIRTPQGGEVPFYGVARASRGRGFANLRRANRQRVINVTADVDPKLADANRILADVEANTLPDLLAAFPGLSYGLEGEQREQRKTITALARNYAFALALIYALLAVPLRSYGQPLIIMAVIPFGLVGAIAGHLIMGAGFSMMSVFGVVALSGVVVNSSLVLVHHINQRRERGAPIAEAVRDAGVARFRPILLTSLTTFAGLSPILLERNMGAQFLIPMATSLAFGVAFATAISLFLLPASYLILEDLRLWARGPLPRPLEVVVTADRKAEPGAGIARVGEPRR
ncbi:MAG: efflux RND transporter permease subunit [Myxococcales bacterium]|nr:efflux RND transporter permease subunit [Myxococcales bacterium]